MHKNTDSQGGMSYGCLANNLSKNDFYNIASGGPPSQIWNHTSVDVRIREVCANKPVCSAWAQVVVCTVVESECSSQCAGHRSQTPLNLLWLLSARQPWLFGVLHIFFILWTSRLFSTRLHFASWLDILLTLRLSHPLPLGIRQDAPPFLHSFPLVSVTKKASY